MKKILFVLIITGIIAGSNVLAIDPGDLIVDGKIGIKTLNPDKELDVNGQIKWGYGQYDGLRTPDQPKIGQMRLSHYNGADIGLVEYISDDINTYVVIGGFSTALNGITKLGIHTSSNPMTNSATSMMEFRNADTVIVNPTNQEMDFIVKDHDENYAIFVQGSSGNIGIGTNAPQSKLAVIGLPTVKPEDGSSSSHVLCITGNGNLWIDNSSPYDCQ